MKFLVYIIVSLFVYESISVSCVLPQSRKSATKKHASARQISSRRSPASVHRANKISSSHSKKNKRAQVVPLPRKKQAAISTRNTNRGRRIASISTPPAKRMTKKYPTTNRRLVAQAKHPKTAQQKPTEPLLSYMDGQQQPEHISSTDNVNVSELDTEAMADIEANGTKTVSGDRANIMPEDPILTEIKNIEQSEAK